MAGFRTLTPASGWNPKVALPPGLSLGHVARAVEHIEREGRDLLDLFYEQANVFSAVVGILGARALDSVSPYERDPNRHVAQTRFPDLIRRGAGPRRRPEDFLESKASKRPWELQSHYDHAGWYVVWRYLVDPTASIVPKKPLLIWRVDLAFLRKRDWKYEGSGAGSGRGGRTHTFGLRRARERLRDHVVFHHPKVVLRGGKPGPRNGG